MVTSTISAWERWTIFPVEYTDNLWLCYKHGSKGELSLEDRLNRQFKEKTGLYSDEYEAIEEAICPDKNGHDIEDEMDYLPSGFKKTDSWVSLNNNDNVKVVNDVTDNIYNIKDLSKSVEGAKSVNDSKLLLVIKNKVKATMTLMVYH